MDPKKLDIRSGKGLRLLSFDGGGARALSQIKIVENIIKQLNATIEEDERNRVVLPCKCFDLLGGSDTGGVLAIMFGKLSMTVEEAYIEFNKIQQEVYVRKLSAEERAMRLRNCIEDLLRRRGLPIDLKLQGDGGCPCFVITTQKSNLQNKIMLRSYSLLADFSANVTVVEAILATCATQPMFAPVSIGSSITNQELIGGTIGLANPSQELITEAQAKFDSDQKVSVILSVGTGHSGVLAAPSSSTEQWEETLWKMVTNSEQIAQDMENRLGGEGIYFRFSVNQAFPDHSRAIDDAVVFNTYTQDYLDNEEVVEKLRQCVKTLRLRLNTVGLEQLDRLRGSDIGRVANVYKLMEEEKERKLLDGLKTLEIKPAQLPGECMEGTRQDILQEIENWVLDIGTPNVLWIVGHPGVGKSAIASTVVNKLRRNKRLGASFFFQRAYASISSAHTLWRTVALDLAERYESVRQNLVSKLEADPDMLTTESIDDLFHQLIYEPLMASKNIPTKRLPVIVIDALDECGGLDGRYSRHRKNVLRTLIKWFNLPKWFKLIVTSRVEQDIERVLRSNSHIIEIFAGPRVSLQSSEDIKSFLVARFQQITDEYSTLKSDWPGDQLTQQLTKLAGGLFIWARTVIEFISRSQPEAQLGYIMEGDDTVGDMGALYSQILQISFQDPTPKVINTFHAILGAVIFLQRPLPATSVARLLSIEDTRMQHICNKLKAVIDVGDVLQINHQTFVEFLLDSKACSSLFCIRREEEEPRLAQACFQTMKRGLKFNICDIGSSYKVNSETEDLKERIQRKIPHELSYSSHHWADHLSECDHNSKIEEYLQNFMEVQFLYWLEILSVTIRMNTASTMLSLSIAWMKKHSKHHELSTDLIRFVKTFINVISQSVPHIYISALPFTPRTSTVSRFYLPLYPQSLNIEAGGLERWPIFQSVIYGHTGPVTSVDFSPDGLKVASGSVDGILRVWDAETGDTIAGPFQGHNREIESVAFSPDGKRIVSGSRDETVKVWASTTGRIVAGPFRMHRIGIYSVAFSPDGNQIVLGLSNHTILILDADTGDTVAGPFTGHAGIVRTAAFSPDGRWIVSGSEDETIRVWDVRSGILATEPFIGHLSGVFSVTFSLDGQRITSGSSDGTVRVWDAKTGQLVAGPFGGYPDMVNSVAFSPDGRRVVSGSDEGVKVWDTYSGGIIPELFEGHTNTVTSVAFSPDGSRIVSGSRDSTVRVWDAGIRENIEGLSQEYTDQATAVAFSPDGSQIVSGSDDSTIRIWDAQTGEAVTEPLRGHCQPIISVAFAPDGRRIVSGSKDKTIKLWDTTGGQLATILFRGFISSVSCLALSPNGQQVACGSWDGTITVLDSRTGDFIIGPLQGHFGGILSLAFSYDGRRIVSGANDELLIVWDVETGRIIEGPLETHSLNGYTVAFSPDGTQIASGSTDGAVRVWDIGTGDATFRVFKGHSKEVLAVTFSQDGRWLVSGSADNKVIVWSVEAGEIVSGPFIGHTRSVSPIAISPDGQRVVSASVDKTIRVWKTHLQTQSDLPFTTSSKLDRGWILDSKDRRLFWVPPTLRDGLLRPGAECIIGNFIKTRLNLDSFVYGEDWTLCRDSGPSMS